MNNIRQKYLIFFKQTTPPALFFIYFTVIRDAHLVGAFRIAPATVYSIAGPNTATAYMPLAFKTNLKSAPN